MDEKVLNRLLAQALVDTAFRKELLSQGATVLARQGIPFALLQGLPLDEAKSLEELARLLLPVFNGHEED